MSKFKKLGYSALGVIGVVGAGAQSTFAAGEQLEPADLSALVVTAIGNMSTEAYLILGATVTIIVALILWKFGVKKVKSAVR